MQGFRGKDAHVRQGRLWRCLNLHPVEADRPFIAFGPEMLHQWGPLGVGGVYRFALVPSPEFIDDPHAALVVASNGTFICRSHVETYASDATVQYSLQQRPKRFAANVMGRLTMPDQNDSVHYVFLQLLLPACSSNHALTRSRNSLGVQVFAFP